MELLTTTAIVRIKRRIEENPLDALILNCKRFKYDNDKNPISNIINESASENEKVHNVVDSKTDRTLFKFVGTINKEENPIKYMKNNRKVDIKHEQFDQIIEKIKKEHKDLSKQNRLKIINCYRSIKNDDDESTILSSPDQVIDDGLTAVIVDVESSSVQQQEEQEIDDNIIIDQQNDNRYVYDIYFTTNNEQFNDKHFTFDLLQSIEPLDDVIFNDDKYRDNDDVIMSDDDSDSNDENNWRNDYPDDEEFDNIIDNTSDNDDIELLNNIIKSKFKINKQTDNDDEYYNNELSTSDDDDNEYYDNDIAMKFGKRYAQFKAREKDDDDEYGIDRDDFVTEDE